MKEVFIVILNQSYQASIVILLILVARYLLTIIKVPKRYTYSIWLIPFIRMCCPFTVESIFSLLPKESSPIKVDSTYIDAPKVYMGDGGEKAASTVLNQSMPASSMGRTSPNQVGLTVFLWLWLLVVAVLVIYSMVSYIRLRRRLAFSILLKENIYLTDKIDTPFVLGVLKPHIYVPSTIGERELEYVLTHERMHIKRGDHAIKALAYLITCVYWFNPLSWIAFTFLSKDMEMSCDEAVMSNFGEEGRKEYATTLLILTTGKKHPFRKRGLGGAPLAFGKGDTKKRIKNIMNYRKPKVIISALVILVIFGLILGLLTNPVSSDQMEGSNHALKESVSSTAIEHEVISITPPELEYNTNLGADGPSLDYAGNGIVIFHGYFGLFVYSMDAKRMVGAIDLAAIGCDYTQGDNYCAVKVSADGGTVYLHPMSEKYMYVYLVSEKELYKTTFSLEGVELFDQFVDSSYYMEGNIGYYSTYGVEYDGKAGKYYGYLQAEDWTMESLKYIEGEKELLLFQEYFSTFSNGNYPKLYYMSVIQSEVSDTGATVEIHNDSDQAIDYGEDFRIKRNVNGAWVNVVYATEHFGFQNIAYSIPANEASVVKIDWELLYGKLPVGQYRLIKDLHVKAGNGKYKVISLAAEFEILKGSGYAKALNDDEIVYVEKLAKSYYEEEFIFDLLSLSLTKEDTIYTYYPEYEPGNIAVFQAETTQAGKGVYRYIVYVREDKKSEWVKINEGK